jgi:hypothetical protein
MLPKLLKVGGLRPEPMLLFGSVTSTFQRPSAWRWDGSTFKQIFFDATLTGNFNQAYRVKLNGVPAIVTTIQSLNTVMSPAAGPYQGWRNLVVSYDEFKTPPTFLFFLCPSLSQGGEGNLSSGAAPLVARSDGNGVYWVEYLGNSPPENPNRYYTYRADFTDGVNLSIALYGGNSEGMNGASALWIQSAGAIEKYQLSWVNSADPQFQFKSYVGTLGGLELTTPILPNGNRFFALIAARAAYSPLTGIGVVPGHISNTEGLSPYLYYNGGFGLGPASGWPAIGGTKPTAAINVGVNDVGTFIMETQSPNAWLSSTNGTNWTQIGTNILGVSNGLFYSKKLSRFINIRAGVSSSVDGVSWSAMSIELISGGSPLDFRGLVP